MGDAHPGGFPLRRLPPNLILVLAALVPVSLALHQRHPQRHPNQRTTVDLKLKAAAVGPAILVVPPPPPPPPTTTTSTTTSSSTTTSTTLLPRPATHEVSRSQGPGRDLGMFKATCYDLGGRTASGQSAGPGSIAVDPSVIPLGTRLDVQGYGPGVADDTGGAIRGRRIDVWMPNYADCAAWGVRWVDVRAA